jgi:hypothetical protein
VQAFHPSRRAVRGEVQTFDASRFDVRGEA